MSQEFEEVFNQIQLDNPDITPEEANKQASVQLAEKKKNELDDQSEESTDSQSSDGTFRFVGEVLPSDPSFAVTGKNLLLNSEFDKLQKLAFEMDSAEDRANLYSQFSEETAVQLPQENFEQIESSIARVKEREDQFNSDFQNAYGEAFEQRDFDVVSSVLEDYDIPQEQIADIREDFFKEQTQRDITQGEVLDSWRTSYSAREFERQISGLDIPDDQRESLVQDYDRYLIDLGEGMYNAIYDRAFELDNKIRTLVSKGQEQFSDENLQSVAAQNYRYELNSLKFEYQQAQDAANELAIVARDVPEVKPALAMISIERTRFMDSLDDSVKAQVKSNELDMYEAAWLSSDEYDQYQEYIRAAQNLTAMKESRIKQMEDAKDDFIERSKQDQKKREIDIINKYVAKDLEPDEMKALENAIMKISGNAYDLEKKDGKVGFETPALTDAILRGMSSLVDLGPAMFRTGANLRDAVFLGGVSALTSDEDYSRLLDEQREIKTRSRKNLLTFGALEAARDVTTSYEDGIMDSFRNGNIAAGINQSVSMAFEAMPITLATMAVSSAAGVGAGYAFASAISAGMEYEEVFEEEWFKSLSPLERSAYIGGVGAAEGLSESIGAGVASRFLKGGKSKAIGQLRSKYLANRFKGVAGDYITDAGSEVGVVYAQAGLDLAFNEGADLSNLTDEAVESAIVSFIMSGSMQTAGAINSLSSTNTDPDVLFSSKDLQNRITNILNTTTPRSKTRVQQIELMMEDASIASQIKADAFEVYEFIRNADPATASEMAKNSRSIASALRTIENSTNKDDIRQARETIEQIVVENKKLEQSVFEAYTLSSEGITKESVDKLQKRAKDFSRQANKLQRQGKESAAASLRSRVDRINGQLESVEIRESIAKNDVISSEGKNVDDLSKKIGAMARVAVVDSALAEKMSEMGYAVVEFDGTTENVKLVIKDAQGLESSGGSIESVIEEIDYKKLEKEGNFKDQDIVAFVGLSQARNEELTDYQKELKSRDDNRLADQIDSFAQDISTRKADDIVPRQFGFLGPTVVDEAVQIQGDAKKAFDKLSSGLGLTGASVVTQRELFKRDYADQTTEEGRQRVLDNYLNGTEQKLGGYDKNTREILLTENSTVKDVVEEFAHAYIHQRLEGVDNVSVKFTNSLMKILRADPAISQAVNEKRQFYIEKGFTGSSLQEEMLVEVFAQYVANSDSASRQTKNGLQSLFDSVVSMFSSSGGNVDSVMRKLSDTLLSESEAGDIRESFEELFGLSVDQADAVRESQQLDQSQQQNMESSRRPSFLDNKVVTYQRTMRPFEDAPMARPIGDKIEKRFNDYFHFVNWYRKMTGNGRFTRLGFMTYVDDNGNVRSLKPPKPLLDKETGQPIYMEPVLKSPTQMRVQRGARLERERVERVKVANKTMQVVGDQLHDIIERETGKLGVLGDSRQIIKELMADFTEKGTVNEENLDAYGRPITEKRTGTPEYQEQVIERTNEWLENNYPGNSILFSSTSNKRMMNGMFLAFGEKDPIRANQKRKNLEALLSKILGVNDPAVRELRSLIDRQEKGKIGGAVPRALINAAISAFDVHVLGLDPNMTTEEIINSHELNNAYVKRLVAIDKVYDKAGRNFYKNYQNAIDDLLTEAGTRIDSEGNPIEDKEFMQLAKTHKDLFTAIVAITSNGSKAEVNLAEALAVYHVALDEYSRTGAVGVRTKARIELIRRQYVFTNSRATPSRGKNIAMSLERLFGFDENPTPMLQRATVIGLFGTSMQTPSRVDGKRTPRYHFDNPGYFRSRVALKNSGKTGSVKEVKAQQLYGPKIGAFMANLYGRKDVFTQDLHVSESLNRVYRPLDQYRIDTPDLLKTLKKKYKTEEASLALLRKEGLILSEEKGVISLDTKAVAQWISRITSRTDCLTSSDPYLGGLRLFLESKLQPATKPTNRTENIKISDNLLSILQTQEGYKNATKADLGQLIFLENHALQNALGVAGRSYDAFSGEVVENAREGFREYLAYGFGDIGLTNKAARRMLADEAIGQYPAIDVALTDIIEQNASMKPGEAMVMFSSKKLVASSNHPQSKFYIPSEIFKGRQVSSAKNARFKPGRINLNKLLEGRATEDDAKYKVQSFGASDQFTEPVSGVMFMRNPLYADAFVDAYGNRLKYADNVVISGEMIIASGNIRIAEPVAEKGRTDEVYVESPEHFVAYQNFVSIIGQRNQSLRDMPQEFFEQAYKSLSSKERARFANLTIDEHGNVIKGRKLRGTSKRVANSSEFGRFKAEIVNNPNNYIDQQKIAEQKKLLEDMSPQELVSLMRGDALNNLATRNDDVGVLAGIELINRLQEEGNDIGIVSVLDQLAAVGTTAGRVLRHMAELKTSSPQGMANVIIKKSEAQGKILSEAQKKEILDATKRYMEAYRLAEKFMERGIAGEDVENQYKRAVDELDAAQRDMDTLANKYVEKTWAEIGQQLVQGNLLTMMSQSRNVVYNIANIIPKTVIDIMSMPTSKAFELLGLGKEQRKLSLAGYLYAMNKFGGGVVEAMEQVITGREKDMAEWRMSRGFMPIRSLMHAMSTDLPEGQRLRDEFNQRAKLLVQGTFGIPAEAMFRLLSLGDVPFRRFAEGLELYNLGRGKGLEGEALAQFLKFPDKDSAEQGATEGRKLTFQEPMGLARGSMWIIDNMARGMGQAFKNVKGFNAEGFFKFLIRLNVPYVSTIANFTEETLTYASPVFGGGKMAIQMSNGEYTEASKTLSKVMVGQAVSSTALYLISEGLLSGSVDWEDDEKTNLMYDTFPPNSINVSGLRRLMNGEDPSPQAGDEFRSYQTLGVFGTIMGAYAHSTTPEAAREMQKQPFTSNNMLKKLFGFDNVSVIAYMMDQSFLQGLNGITSVIASTSDPDDFERAFFRYAETISKAFSSMFLPNVLSGVDQATREHLPDKRDVDLADRIKNHVRERTFNTGGLPVKVNWKGERIDQAPVGGNQFAYYMFDAMKSRTAPQDEVSIEILNLYLDTGVLTKAVGTPYYASSVYKKLRPPSVKRGKAKKAYANLGKRYQFLDNPQEDFFVRMTSEEINNALEMSNTLRYNDIQSYMQTEEYQKMSNNEKIEALDDINDRYKSLLSYNPDGSFMEHSKYILEIMERRYLEQYGED